MGSSPIASTKGCLRNTTIGVHETPNAGWLIGDSATVTVMNKRRPSGRRLFISDSLNGGFGQ